MGRLDGKVALIAGGSSPNNGGTIAHFMAREGAKIACNDIVPETAEECANFLKSRGYDAIALPGDASNVETAQQLIRHTVEHFGYVDTLVNLAGSQYRWPVTDINIDDWNKQLQTFLTSGMLLTKYTALAMIEKEKRGCLVHLISTAGHSGEAGNSGYSAAKAGLLNFARAAAMDLAHYGIRVNTITPYAMEHNLWRYPQGRARTRYMTTTEDFLQSIPLGRFPRASDLANVAVFFASDEAEFLTGVDIPVDGGVRIKYPPWQPGIFTSNTVEEYLKHHKPQRYGEPAES